MVQGLETRPSPSFTFLYNLNVRQEKSYCKTKKFNLFNVPLKKKGEGIQTLLLYNAFPYFSHIL
jgi:hypothetical protein